MDALLNDLRFAFRSIRRAPSFALLAVGTIALGIAATTVVYSAVDGLVLRPFPFPEPSTLVGVGSAHPTIGGEMTFFEHLSPAEYQDIAGTGALDKVVAWDMGNRQVSVGEQAENLFSGFWWGDAFPTLEVRPYLGRGFSPEEIHEGRHVAVLSYRVWRDRFGGDSSLVGGRVLVNGDPYDVVGIMPPGAVLYGMDLWLPMPIAPEVFARNRRQFQVLARLAPGATMASVQSELDVLARRVEATFGAEFREYAGWRLEAKTWNDINVAALRPAAIVLLAAVGFVMLLVSTNIATLLLGRATGRTREMAVRNALGAGRRRLLRQLLTESLLLAVAGATVGVALGYLGVRGVAGLVPALGIPVPGHLAVSGRVLGVSVGVAVLAGLAFGIVPALYSLRVDPQRTLQSEAAASTGTASRLRLQQLLVAVEAALAVTLLAGSGYLLHSFVRLRAVEPGFAPERVLTLRLSLARERYQADAIEPFFADLRERLAGVAGVRSVATASQFPPVVFSRFEFRIEGRAADASPAAAFATLVSPGYFSTLRIPVIEGRTFSPFDGPDAPRVAIVNEVAARRYFPAGAVGSRIRIGTDRAPWTEVVGVVASTKNRGLDRDAAPEIFAPSLQLGGFNNQMFVLIRSAGEPRALLPAVRAVVKALDPEQPIYAIRTLQETIDESQVRRRVPALLLTLFGGFALGLAAVGIYGVVSYATSQRTREVGVRVALGASRSQVARLFVRQALLPVGVGAVVGLALALALGRLMSGLLFEVGANDLATLGLAAGLLVVIGLAAAWAPARRAARLDPVRALHGR